MMSRDKRKRTPYFGEYMARKDWFVSDMTLEKIYQKEELRIPELPPMPPA